MNNLTLPEIKMKNRAYHRFLKTKDQHNCQIKAKYRNESKNACRKAVTDYEKSLSREVKSNPKAFFRYTKNKWLQLDSNQEPVILLTNWLVSPNGWVFVYKLSGSGFESSCSHLNFRFRACFEQGVPWHAGSYKVWIHPETRTWHDKNLLAKLNFEGTIPDLVDNGKILSDGNNKVNALNMFFKKVFPEESDCLPDFNLNVTSSIEHVPFLDNLLTWIT